MKSQAVTIIEPCINFMAFTAKHNICFVIHSNDFSIFWGQKICRAPGSVLYLGNLPLDKRRRHHPPDFDVSLSSLVIKSPAVMDGDNAVDFMSNQALAATIFLL